MKKNVFLVLVLIVLFVFGVLIYDFSDEMDKKLTSHEWFIKENNMVYVMSFKNNKFSYKTDNNEEASNYVNCDNYHFNSNVNVVKVACNAENKKLFIASFDEEELVLTMDGVQKTFYSSKELALVEDFKKANELSDEEYDNLLSINFNEELFIDYKEFNTLYKAKSKVYIGVVSSNVNYKNVYSYTVLNRLIDNSSKDFYLINVDDLTEKELTKLNNITKETNYSESVFVFEVGKKKCSSKVNIEVLNKEDLNAFKNI